MFKVLFVVIFVLLTATTESSIVPPIEDLDESIDDLKWSVEVYEKLKRREKSKEKYTYDKDGYCQPNRTILNIDDVQFIEKVTSKTNPNERLIKNRDLSRTERLMFLTILEIYKFDDIDTLNFNTPIAKLPLCWDTMDLINYIMIIQKIFNFTVSDEIYDQMDTIPPDALTLKYIVDIINKKLH